MPVSPRKAASARLAAKSWRACNESARRATDTAGLLAARDSEPITAATDRLDGFQLAFGVELLPEATDEDFQDIGVAVEILLVDVLGEIGLRDELAGMQHEVLEHLVLVARQVHARAVDADRLCGQVQADRAAVERRLAPARGAAQQRVDAREQLLDMEGLDQVIVGAGLQALDLVLPRRA